LSQKSVTLSTSLPLALLLTVNGGDRGTAL
jgi:hypothetical protein